MAKIGLANIWRKQQGLVPLTMPAPLKIQAVPEAEIAPLLTAVVKDAGRGKALSKLEALGLPALPPVKRLLASLPKDHPAYKDLQQLASRLRQQVQEVSFAGDSVTFSPELQQQFSAWKDKRIKPEALVEQLLSAMGKLPATVFGVRVALEHPGDDTGITLVVALTEKRALFHRGPGKNWVSSERVILAGTQIHQMDRGRSKPIDSGELKDFLTAFRMALDAPAEQSLSVRLAVAVDQK